MTTEAMLLAACPHCRRRYRVRADQVPPQGTRARCPHCGAIFPVVPGVGAPTVSQIPPSPMEESVLAGAGPGAGAGPDAGGAATLQAAPAAAPSGPGWNSDLEKARPERGVIGEVRPRPVDGHQANGVDSPAAAPLDAVPAHEHARTLARALASDILAYHPEKVASGLATGKLVRMLGQEIAASWQLYVQEVGEDLARTTPYFRQALNQIVSGGRDYF